MIKAIVIPGQPVGKGRPRFTKTGHTYTDRKTVEAERAIAEAYKAKYGNDIIPADQPVGLRIYAGFRIPKSDTKQKKADKINRKILPTIKSDIDNICKLVMDGLNGVAYEDDKQVVIVLAGKVYAEEPMVYVEIEEILDIGSEEKCKILSKKPLK